MACKLCKSDRAKYAMMLAMGQSLGMVCRVGGCALPDGHSGEHGMCEDYSQKHCLAQKFPRVKTWDKREPFCV